MMNFFGDINEKLLQKRINMNSDSISMIFDTNIQVLKILSGNKDTAPVDMKTRENNSEIRHH